MSLNKNNYISHNEIESCIKLLGYPYNKNNLIIQILNCTSDCLGEQYLNRINIYPINFNTMNKDSVKAGIIYILYHEMRHAYQSTYYEDRFIMSLNDNKKYLDKWIEKDANQFAIRNCIRNNKEIEKILNIKYNYKLFWKQFKKCKNSFMQDGMSFYLKRGD